MPSIDERVVAMAFENAKFEQNVAQTMATLGKLDESLKKIGQTNSLGDIEKSASKVTLQQPMSALDKLKSRLFGAGQGAAEGLGQIDKAGSKVELKQPLDALDKVQSRLGTVGSGAAQGFSEIERASSRVSLQGLTSSLDSVTAKFSVLQGAASVALGNITSQAVMRGTAWAKSFTFAPIMDGLNEYQTNLKSIQTVQANTDRPLTEINASLSELNKYSDQTIYNFSEMARNIGTFTAAGVDLKTATSSIKGIANLAALSGSNSQQAATAMYQLSQAISSGKVGLQDWNSVVNAGMGGKKLQTALATTAIAMGDIKGQSVKLEGPMKKLTINGQSFRESIMAKPGQKAWLSSEVLVNTLATLDGRFSRAALGAEMTKDGLKKYTAAQIEAKIADSRAFLEKKNGVKYTDEQFKNLMRLSDSAYKSATEVKTLGQVFDVAKETIGSGWSQSFQSIFGNLTEAKKLFTGMSNTINGFINKMALARNTVLHDWKELGGRAALIEGLKNAFKALFAILKPIGQAFRDIFPRKTGEDLANMTKNFRDFTEKLQPSAAVVDGLRRTFAGVFAVLHIGYTVVKDVAKVFFDLLGVVGKGGGGFLAFTGGIGDFLVALDNALTKGGLLNSFFKSLSGFIQAPVKMLAALASGIFGLFGGNDSNKATAFGDSLHKVSDAAGPLSGIIVGLTKAWKGLVNIFKDIAAYVTPFLQKIGEQFQGIAPAIANAISNADFNSVLQALQTTFLGGIFFAIKKALSGGLNFKFGAFDGVNKALGQLTGTLQSMQTKVRAQVLILIAGAIGILAASTYVLAQIDPKRLSSALTAMAVGLGELFGAIKLMTTGFGKTGILLLPVLGAGLILVATSTVILAGAMKIFSTMKWEDIAKGLAGVAGGLTAIGLGMKFLGPGTVIQGPAILLLAVALNALAIAVKMFAEMKWEDMARGLVGVLGSLAAIAPLAVFGPGLLVAGPGLVAVALGMSMLAGAVTAFSAIDPAKMAVGLVGLATAMLTMAGAISLFPPNLAVQAAGILILSVALTALSGAVAVMGKMKIENVIRGLTGLAGVMLILAVGLGAMEGTVPGIAALIGVAAALAIIAPTLAFLGMLSVGTIVKGLVAIAAVLATLAIAGTLAGPGLTALGIAMLPLAGVFVLTAGAVFLFAKALDLLGATGGKGIAVMVTALTAFVALIPKIVIDFLSGLVGIAEEIAKIAPKVTVALGVVLDTIIAFVIQNAGKFAVAMGALIDAGVAILITNAPKLIAAGARLLTDLLNGITGNMPQVIVKVATIVAQFLSGMAANAGKLVSAGAHMLVSFLNGITANLPKVVASVGAMIVKFLTSVTGQLPRIIGAGSGLITAFVTGVLNTVGRLAITGVKVVTNIINGIANALPKIVSAAGNVITKFINAVADTGPRIVDAGFKALIKFLHGLATAIRNNDKALVDAGIDIAKAIVQGVVHGLGEIGSKLIKPVVENLFNSLPKWARKVLGIHSPSTVFAEIGGHIVGGLAIGLSGMDPVLEQSITDPLRRMIAANKDIGAFGKFIGTEFKDGLTGGLFDDGKSQSSKTIDGAFVALNAKLHEGQKKLHDTIKADQDKLTQELDKKPKDQDQKLIASLSSNLKKNRNLLSDATQATTTLVGNLRETQKDLVFLGDQYTEVSQKLDTAKAALDAATQARDDAFKSYRDQFNTTPDIGGLVDSALADAQLTEQERADKKKKALDDAEKLRKIDQVAVYKKALQDQLNATKQYQDTLAKLRAAGLDDTTYKKLLADGTKDSAFAQQLLASGKAGIDQINALDQQMLDVSTQIANDASQALYQAGVDAAAGIVKGLQDQQNEIRTTMEGIAEEMVNALKRKLKIKSPSQVFMEVGKFSAQGVAYGITKNTGVVSDAAQGMGDAAVSGIQNSMLRIGDAMSVGIDSNPKITPVLDLTNIRSGAKEIGALGDIPIAGSASYGLAAGLSNQIERSGRGQDPTAAPAPSHITFEQTINSPETLTPGEIYRQTKNGLSQVKSALGVTQSSLIRAERSG